MKIRTLKHLAVIDLDKYDPKHVLEVAKNNKDATVLKDEDGNEIFRVNFVEGNYYNTEDLNLGVTISARKEATDITIAFAKPLEKRDMAKAIAPMLPKLNAVLAKFGEAVIKYDAAVDATLAMFEDNEEVVAEEVNEEA